MGFWLVGWAVGESLVIAVVLTGNISGLTGLFVLAWLGGWTLAGYAAIRSFLWELVGREVLDVDGTTVRLRRDLPPFGSCEKLAVTAVYNLHVDEDGDIAFDYEDDSYWFGESLSTREAKRVFDRLSARFPALARAPGYS
jgi:hypothetical protein